MVSVYVNKRHCLSNVISYFRTTAILIRVIPADQLIRPKQANVLYMSLCYLSWPNFDLSQNLDYFISWSIRSYLSALNNLTRDLHSADDSCWNEWEILHCGTWTFIIYITEAHSQTLFSARWVRISSAQPFPDLSLEREEVINRYKILVRTPEEKIPPGRPRHGREDNIIIWTERVGYTCQLARTSYSPENPDLLFTAVGERRRA
jgi:hypothetical protein